MLEVFFFIIVEFVLEHLVEACRLTANKHQEREREKESIMADKSFRHVFVV